MNQTEIRMIEVIDTYIINCFEKNNYTPKTMFQELIGDGQLERFIENELQYWLLNQHLIDYDCFAKENRNPNYEEDED